MKKIKIISTGGTFNKVYNKFTGELDIDIESNGVIEIMKIWFSNYEIESIIGKDSLFIDNNDREKIYNRIMEIDSDKIIIIHGTDTIDLTAKYLAKKDISKKIVLTGAMIPYSINPIEATANLSSAIGYINGIDKDGIYISLNGVMGDYREIIKDRANGRFMEISLL